MKNLRIYFYSTLCLFLSINITFSQEVCDNGIDDDGDGLIDLNDSLECSCIDQSLTPINNSIIPNPSFEEMSFCPPSMSAMVCVDNWVSATQVSSPDYFNTCGYITSASPLPLPDGDGYAGMYAVSDYKEYIGVCLTAPMLAGQEYIITLDIVSVSMAADNNICPVAITFSAYDFTIYGHQTCPTFPVNISQAGCPVDIGWSVLGFVSSATTSNWGNLSITFTPTQNINALIIGPPCTLPLNYPSLASSPCLPYTLVDNLVLNYAEPIQVSISQTGAFCDNTLTLQASSSQIGGTWQWYFDGIALVGEISNILTISNGTNQSGIYSVRHSQGGVCGTESFNLIIPCPLPIELAEFDVLCYDDEIEINWITASEYYSDYFDIQFSEDGYDFKSVTQVPASGNSNNQNSYHYNLRVQDFNKGYYRLKQVDIDGEYSFSDIVYGDCGVNDIQVSLVEGQIIIANYNELFNCIIFDITGKELFNSPNIESFNIPSQNACYFIQVETERGWSNHKLFIY